MFDEFDKSQEKSYNRDNTTPDFSQPITIDMKNKKPINDPKCQHDWYLDVADPDSSWVQVWKCKTCPYGKLTPLVMS